MHYKTVIQYYTVKKTCRIQILITLHKASWAKKRPGLSFHYSFKSSHLPQPKENIPLSISSFSRNEATCLPEGTPSQRNEVQLEMPSHLTSPTWHFQLWSHWTWIYYEALISVLKVQDEGAVLIMHGAQLGYCLKITINIDVCRD